MQEVSSDHDLLIEIKTKVNGLTDEVRLMRDDTKREIKEIQATKVNVSEFNEHKLQHAKDDIENANRLEKIDKRFETNESKIDNVLRNMYIAVGALIVIQILLPYILKRLGI